MKPADLQEVVAVCRMLADSTRLSLIVILAKGAKPVTALVDELRIQQPAASHHLALLRMSGLVDRKRRGRAQIYSLNRAKLAPVRAFLAKMK